MKPSTLDHVLYSWYMARFFNSHWHDYSVIDTILQQLLAPLFNSHWHHCSTDTGTIVQQSLAGLFNSGWQDYSSVAGTIVQQSLAPLFNSHGQDFFLFLCWQNSSTVMFIVEESCHVPGIRHMIQAAKTYLKLWY